MPTPSASRSSPGNRAAARLGAFLHRWWYALVVLLDRVPGPLLWRSWNARRRGRSFDRRYGTDTQSHAAVVSLGLPEDLAVHAVHYEPSTIPKVRRALRHLRVPHQEYKFIDVGSGKGLVSLLAARCPFQRVIGIEASSALCRIAERNLELYGLRGLLRAPVTFVNANALDYEYPSGKRVVYLYNPFDAALLRAFVERLVERGGLQDTVVVYVNPLHREMFESRGAFAILYCDRTLVIYRGGAMAEGSTG